MTSFVADCGLALVAAVLGATGGAHLAGLPGFVRLLRRHGLLPSGFAAPAALAVTVAELATAGAAVAALAGRDPRLGTAAFAAALASGTGFLVYLRRLRRSGHAGSCGCSPLAGPSSPASFVPAAALAIAGALGLAASGVAGGLPAPSGGAWSALAAAWGIALAALVLLLPATAPAKAAEAAP